jgi:hypothetical protein
MNYSLVPNNRWLTYTNIVEALSSGDQILKSGQTISNSNRFINKLNVTNILDIDLSNSNLVNKINNQWVTKNDLVKLTITDFDFLAIRYGWINGAGEDLDTLTGFEDFITGSTAIDGRYVGYPYSTGGIDIYNPGSYSNGEGIIYNDINKHVYLCHGGDNTSNGGEMVLIDFKNIKLDYPSTPTILTASINTIWYNSIGTTPSVSEVLPGQVTFQVVAWKGGSMSKGTALPDAIYYPTASISDISYYDWCNPNATKVSYYQTFQKQCLVLNIDNINYSTYSFTYGTPGVASSYAHIGTLSYNSITQTITLNY